MNIFRKVFLSFLGLTAITLLITLGLARWSFDQGFLDFVAGLEQQRLGELSVTVQMQTIWSDSVFTYKVRKSVSYAAG